MNWRWIAVAAVALATTAAAGEERVINGGFEQSNFGWRFDQGIRAVDEGGAKQLEVKLHRSKIRSITQRVTVKPGDNFWKITLRVKPLRDFVPADKMAEQITIRCQRDDQTESHTAHKVLPNLKWQDLKWDFTDFKGTDAVNFTIEFHPGDGHLIVDDVKIESL